MSKVKENKNAKKIDVNHIYDLTKSTPNNMILGEKIRQYIYECEETR